MLDLWGAKHSPFCDGISRREFLKVGSFGVGGLTLADLLRLQGQSAETGDRSAKAVIMVVVFGGVSHIDTHDMKPEAPAEIRSEFRSIQTSVPGIRVCELMPLQARIAD